MPVISSFFGIYIRMYHDDHPPPHIRAEYHGHEAFVLITTGEILKGHLPNRAARLVKEWCLERQVDLMNNWQRAQALRPLEAIPGADHD